DHPVDEHERLPLVEGPCGDILLGDEQDVRAPGLEARIQLMQERAADAAALAIGIDVDPVQLRLRPLAVVVQVARDLSIVVGDEEVRVDRPGAERDAGRQRLDRVRLLHDRDGGLGTDDGVVHGSERDPADGGDPGRITDLSRPDRDHVRILTRRTESGHPRRASGPLTPGPEAYSKVARFQLAIAAIAALARSAISSGGTSSTWVAIDHTCPNGSVTVPKRSPQNWSVTSIVTLPPASTAFCTRESTSSTYRKSPALVPPSSLGGRVLACGNG